MSLVVAAIMLSSALQGGGVSGAEGARTVSAAATPAPASPKEAAAIDAARIWLGLVDDERWQESWRTAAPFFKAQISAGQWALAIRSARQPLGAVSLRNIRSVTTANTLPGAPSGDYVVIQFQTSFAGKKEGGEAITLVQQGSSWKVVGYFIT